jgi:carbon monoxide dehydrogenase subunit G
MRDFRTSIDIAAPPDRVWSIMRDVERWHEWTASITGIERLDDGPLRVGSRARVRQPKLPTNEFVVTALEEGRGFTWESKSLGVRGIGHHSIEPTARGCRVTLGVDFRGPLAWVVSRVYGKLTQRYIEMEANGLARTVGTGKSH